MSHCDGAAKARNLMMIMMKWRNLLNEGLYALRIPIPSEYDSLVVSEIALCVDPVSAHHSRKMCDTSSKRTSFSFWQISIVELLDHIKFVNCHESSISHYIAREMMRIKAPGHFIGSRYES